MQKKQQDEEGGNAVKQSQFADYKQKCIQAQQNQEQRNLMKMLLPANPLITKQIKGSQQYINMKLLQPHNQRNVSNKKLYINHPSPLKKVKQNLSEENEEKIMNLFNGYNSSNLIYLKYDNAQINQRNRKKYFSSIFSPISLKNNKFEMVFNIPGTIGMTKKIINPQKSLIINLQQQLQFFSNFQSGNLFAVYKTGAYQYDLILQNDFNTNGCTQWFYFEVQNRKNNNFVAKFNIVNLYKADSLYNKGMKPVVNSTKSGKGWLRKGFNIFYDQNSLKCQEGKKYYKTLSFCYDFTKQNDTVSFSHSIPYPYSKVEKLIKLFQGSSKYIVKTMGTTPLKKPLKIIKFQGQNKNIEKNAIIIMARQHPGQTQGSFILDQILMNFLKPSQEVQFLLWRFNFYVIPMVNIDGVILGNYRSNAMGFDLNRNWQNQSKSKHPEVYFIKSQIKKIMSKQKIQLILDLHGHSRKMNSFFYGNLFAPNTYLFPYVASKINPFMKFQDCRFSVQKKQKAHTARVVLGNLIKQTGNVYTYEVSFYGGIKKQKKTTFLQQHYKQLGRDLIKSMYKVFNQQYKQQKSLKQSIYLKDIRREITGISDQIQKMQQDSGSDSEAQKQMEEFNRDLNQEIKQIKQQQNIQLQNAAIQDLEKQNLSCSLKQEPYFTLNMENLKKVQNQSQSQFDRLSKILSRNHQSLIQESENFKKRLIKRQIIQMSSINNSLHFNNSINKIQNKPLLHAQKLKIYGETYLIKSPIFETELQKNNRDYQTLEGDRMIHLKNNQSIKLFPQNRNMRNGCYSLNLKKSNLKKQEELKSSFDLSLRQEELMNDIVRINRLEYKKTKRLLKYQQSVGEKSSKEIGVFKLPSIIKQYKK